MGDVIYHLNARDELVFVNQAWSEFAEANGADAMQPTLVLRRSLWDFISDPTTRHIYRALFERIRGQEETIRLSFRCDSPAERRLLDLEMTPLEQGGIQCQVHQVETSSRKPMWLLDPSRPRSEELIRVCSWCKRVGLADEVWLEVEDAVTGLGLFVDQLPPDLTHGICPDCRRVLEARIEGATSSRPLPQGTSR
jgi:hypothetical protein